MFNLIGSTPPGTAISVTYTVAPESYVWTNKRREPFRKVIELQNNGSTHLNVTSVVAIGSRTMDARISKNYITAGSKSMLVLEVYGLDRSKALLHRVIVECANGFVFSFYLKLENETYRSMTLGVVAGTLVGLCVLFGSLEQSRSIKGTNRHHRWAKCVKPVIQVSPLPGTTCLQESDIPCRGKADSSSQGGIRRREGLARIERSEATAPSTSVTHKVVYAEDLERELQSIYGGLESQGEIREVQDSSSKGQEQILELPQPESIPQEPLPPPASKLDLWNNSQDRNWQDVVERCGNNHLSCFIVEPLEFFRD